MANLALTPAALPGGGSVLNLSSGATAIGASTGVTFVNDGQVFLVWINTGTGHGAATATVKIGATVEGQGVTSITESIPDNAVSVTGPYDAAYSAGFGGTAEVDLTGTTTGLSVALCHYKGTS